MKVDADNWSGEGAFTQTLLDTLKHFERIAFLRVEDAPATRAEADYNFVSNEIYVGFEVRTRREAYTRFGFLPSQRQVHEKAMSLADLEGALTKLDLIGPPDYSDAVMMQYLRTERIIPPYQTRGYKLVELVRIYEVGSPPR